MAVSKVKSLIDETSDCSSAYPHPPPGEGMGVGVEKFSSYPHPHLLKFAKVNYHIKFLKKLLEVFAIFLFKLLIIINIEWRTKILKRERETSEEKIINKRGKTDGSTNSDVLISMKDARKTDDWYRLLKPGLKSNSEITD